MDLQKLRSWSRIPSKMHLIVLQRSKKISSSKSQEAIEQINQEIKHALSGLQSATNGTSDHNSILSELKAKLKEIASLGQMEGNQKELNLALSKYTKLPEKQFNPDISKSYRNVDFDFHLVNQIIASHKHAFHLWLVFKRKLKTQDSLSSWEIHGRTDIPMVCALCELKADSHDHLFFECSYATKVWKGICAYADLDHYSVQWDVIVNSFISFAKRERADVIIAKLLLAASTYFNWQERNSRLFNKSKRSAHQLIEVIKATVRLKLLAFRFKKKIRTEGIVEVWKLPKSLLHVTN